MDVNFKTVSGRDHLISLPICTCLPVQSQPLVIETLSQKQVAASLSQRLREIEEAITLFSRKTVLVEE